MDSSGLLADERERLLYYRDARDKAERDWRQNNDNAEALTQWGVALFELAHFHQGTEAIELISQALSKLEMALQINPRKHDALWFLGNALTSQGFLYPDAEKANKYFEKAAECYRRAVAEEPGNEMYKRSLELTAKAPQLHADVQRQLAAQAAVQQQAQQAAAAQAQGASRSDSQDKLNADYDYLYDIGGWVILGALAFGWVLLARQNVQ